MKGVKRAGPVQTRLLTLGREECEFGLDNGAFDAVKNILPGESELDGPDADLQVAIHELKDLEKRIGSLFVHRDILMDRRFFMPCRCSFGLLSALLIRYSITRVSNKTARPEIRMVPPTASHFSE